MELFEDAAHAIGLPADACSFDYFGLNHLGWLREISLGGEPQLHRIWDSDEKLTAAYRSPLFEPEMLRRLQLLPSEYLYYYYRTEVALANIKRAGFGRGELVEKLTSEFFRSAGSADKLVDLYRSYLEKRDSSYMQLETASAPRVKPEWSELSGYDRIAFFTIRAIAMNRGDKIPLNVANRGTLPFLEPDDIIETPCRVVDTGPQPLAVAEVPEVAQTLIHRVKVYERATIKAALTRNPEQLTEALALNPLVPSHDVAKKLVTDFFV
jgi:6-phospho-beta-glucosidase